MTLRFLAAGGSWLTFCQKRNILPMEIDTILNAIYALPADSLSRFLGLVEERLYPKGAHLYRQDARASHIYFVGHGLVRAYARRGTREITFWFGTDGDLAFPIESVSAGSAEYASIDVLEDTRIYQIDVERLRQLYATDIHIANWGRIYAEQACITAEQMLVDRQFKTSLQRYRELLASHPDIVRRVPLGIIASYLGTTQANLSRIRAKV